MTPDTSSVPAWMWWFLLKAALVFFCVVGAAVTGIVWKTGSLPFSGARVKGGAGAHDRRGPDDQKLALLQIVKDNTAAIQGLKSVIDDGKNIARSAIDRLDSIGQVLSRVQQKLDDMHHDVRSGAKLPRQV